MAHPSHAHALSRRGFLQRAASLSALGVGAPLAMNLAAFSEAAAFTATDYKALVCVFLYGGNDYANTVVPYDTANYDLYSAIRGGGANRTAGGIALDRSSLTATALTPIKPQTLTDNIQYALAPELTSLKALWDSGQCAIQLNVGTLIKPTTLAQYQSADRVTNPLPSKLFSHNDQQSEWQSDRAEGATTGWGGNLGDMALSNNANAPLTCISVTGNSVFVSGQTAKQYQISTSGAVAVKALTAPSFGNTTAIKTAFRSLITATSPQTLEDEYTKVTARSINLQGTVSSALSGVTLNTSFNTDGLANSLADQMKVVAQMIGARAAIGVKRQVFFVSLGGFDTHDNLIRDHGPLMAKLNEAIGQFYKATVELGVANQVTTFSASDFGRTLASNGDGSDHGWGSHHFIVGGAVKGGQYYGTAPHVSVTSSDQVGQGRLLPSTAVDQYAATLARWFGVTDAELPTILPNLVNFPTSNLGFMA